MKKIRCIHISDIHYNKEGLETEWMREQLPKYLSEIYRNTNVNYLIITGDLRYAPKGKFPKDVISYIKDIANSLRVSTENTFIIIGNHDVSREDIIRKEAIKEYINNRPYTDHVIEKDLKKRLKNCREDWYKIIKEFVNIESYKLHKNDNVIHFNIETDYVNFVHIDSTIVYHKELQNNFYIGLHDLKKVLDNVNKCKPTIFLSHYPYEYLDPSERRYIIDLMKNNNVKLWLCGHNHINNVSVNEIESQPFITISSGNQTNEYDTEPGFVEVLFDEKLEKIEWVKHLWQNRSWKKFEIKSNEKSNKEKVLVYIKNYNASTIFTNELCNDLMCNQKEIIDILLELCEIGLLRNVSKDESMWEILNK